MAVIDLYLHYLMFSLLQFIFLTRLNVEITTFCFFLIRYFITQLLLFIANFKNVSNIKIYIKNNLQCQLMMLPFFVIKKDINTIKQERKV